MARPSRAEMDAHERAEGYIYSDKPLTRDETEFVYNNWLPYARGRADVAGAFFTPLGLARDLATITGSNGRMVDICAGIGHLCWSVLCLNGWGHPDMGDLTEIVAVEFHHEYVEIGKRLLPWVNWVHADVFDLKTWQDLGQFNFAVSNPPFGNPRSNKGKGDWLSYQGSNELMIAEISLRVTRNGSTLILPQQSVPNELRRSNGNKTYEKWDEESRSYWTDYENNGPSVKFLEVFPDAHFGASSIPTDPYRDLWRGAKPVVELVDLSLEYGASPIGLPATQLALFGD